MSELIDSNAECIVGLGSGETARTPSSDTSDNNESLNAESIVGLRPSHHENNFLEKGGVALISPPSMAGRGGTILSISSDTIGNSPGHFKSNPPDTSEVTHTRSVDKASESHNSSLNVKFDTGSTLVSRRAGQNVSIPSQGDTSKQLHTLINGETGHIEEKIRLAPLPSLQALLELDEMSLTSSIEHSRLGAYRSWWSSNQCWS